VLKLFIRCQYRDLCSVSFARLHWLWGTSRFWDVFWDILPFYFVCSSFLSLGSKNARLKSSNKLWYRSTTIWIFVTLSLCNINNVLYELKCCRAELWSNVAWIEAWRSSRASLVFSIKRKGPLHSRKISTDRTFPENIIVKSRKFSTSEFSFFRPKICVSQSHLITFCGKFSWVEMGLYRSANSAQEMLI
jgi:hypothetical protein